MNATPSSAPPGERLAKIMARNGLCSRREAEAWIAAGRVSVNGKPIRTPAFNVTDKDQVTVDGQPLEGRKATRLWLYNKPAGLVVTEHDPEGRPTIFEGFEKLGLPRVLTVGRLDINTEGLLLLTNDGGLKRVLELPQTGWLRRYRVRAHGRVTQDQLDKLKKGIEVEGVRYGPIDARLEREQGGNVWMLVALREGKNREVKNVLASLGLAVNRLIRISYGPFQLGELPAGQIETVKTKMLRDQLGRKLAAEAGVDFDAPMPETAAPRMAPERPATRGLHPGGARRPPRPAPEAPRPRRLLHPDGRPPEEFVPETDTKPRRGGKPDRAEARPSRAPAKRDFGSRSDRPAPAKPGARGKFGGGEKRAFRSDDGPEREGARPPRRGPRREFGDRPQRADRPARSDRQAPPEKSGDLRPARPGKFDRFGAKKRGPRPEGAKPASRQGRPSGPESSGRPPRSGGTRPPRAEGPRPPRPAGPRGPGKGKR